MTSPAQQHWSPVLSGVRVEYKTYNTSLLIILIANISGAAGNDDGSGPATLESCIVRCKSRIQNLQYSLLIILIATNSGAAGNNDGSGPATLEFGIIRC